MERSTYGYGPPPTSPNYQGECILVDYPNPYFPKPSLTWRPQPPFWYQGDPCPPDRTWPVGDPDDYMFEKLPQPESEKTLLEEMEIERPERYLPGEIYRNERPKRPVEDLSKTANCPKIWIPKDPGFYCEFRPTKEMMNPPLLLDDVLRRKAQTFNSYIIPKEIKKEQTCECVEDEETKAKKKPNFYEALKYADTRSPDFTCEPETRVHFEDACKIPDTSVKVPQGVRKNMLSETRDPNETSDKLPEKDNNGSNNYCD